MAKTLEPLEAYLERVWCDECDEELKSDNIEYSTFPPIYIYTCPKCHKKFEFREEYPKVVYVNKDKE